MSLHFLACIRLGDWRGAAELLEKTDFVPDLTMAVNYYEEVGFQTHLASHAFLSRTRHIAYLYPYGSARARCTAALRSLRLEQSVTLSTFIPLCRGQVL